MKTKMTHTPGPWIITKDPRGMDNIKTPNGKFIAGTSTSNNPNARLIAAAPELLNALKSCHDSPCALQRIYKIGNCKEPCQLCAVIAKAEG